MTPTSSARLSYFNPALRFPRNAPCFCGSGRKFKRCHLDNIQRELSFEDAQKVEKAMEIWLKEIADE